MEAQKEREETPLRRQRKAGKTLSEVYKGRNTSA